MKLSEITPEAASLIREAGSPDLRGVRQESQRQVIEAVKDDHPLPEEALENGSIRLEHALAVASAFGLRQELFVELAGFPAATVKLVELGSEVRKYRTRQGLSAKKLAQLTRSSPATISTLEAGINPQTGRPSRPSRDRILVLASALGLGPKDANSLLQLAGYEVADHEPELLMPSSGESVREHVKPAFLKQLAGLEHDPSLIRDFISDATTQRAGLAEIPAPLFVRYRDHPGVKDLKPVVVGISQRASFESVGARFITLSEVPQTLSELRGKSIGVYGIYTTPTMLLLAGLVREGLPYRLLQVGRSATSDTDREDQGGEVARDSLEGTDPSDRITIKAGYSSGALVERLYENHADVIYIPDFPYAYEKLEEVGERKAKTFHLGIGETYRGRRGPMTLLVVPEAALKDGPSVGRVREALDRVRADNFVLAKSDLSEGERSLIDSDLRGETAGVTEPSALQSTAHETFDTKVVIDDASELAAHLTDIWRLLKLVGLGGDNQNELDEFDWENIVRDIDQLTALG